MQICIRKFDGMWDSVRNWEVWCLEFEVCVIEAYGRRYIDPVPYRL